MAVVFGALSARGHGRGRQRGWRVRAVAVAVVVGLVLSACQWAQVGFGPEHRRYNPDEMDLTIANVASLAQAWSVEVPGAETEPIVADGRVYVTRVVLHSDSGGVWVRSLSAVDGTTVWERRIGSGWLSLAWPTTNARFGEQLSASFTALRVPSGGGLGTCEAATADLNAASGGRPIIHGSLSSSPAVTAGPVLVRSSHRMQYVSGTCQRDPAVIRASELSTGDQLWSARLDQAGASDENMPTVADGRVFVPNRLRLNAYALEGCGAMTCAPLWSTSLTPGGRVVGPAVAEGGQVFVLADVTINGDSTIELIAVNGRSGAVLWRTNLDADRSQLNDQPWIAAAGGTVYVVTPGSLPGSNLLRAFRAGGCGAATCPPLWTATISGFPSPPVVAGGVVYVGTDGHVEAYDADGCGAATCTPVATIPTPEWASELSVAQGKLFVTGVDTVTAYAPASP
jgi:hypothetical protein